MHHPTELANALTPTIWFYSLYSQTSEGHNKSNYPSRLQNSFLLDSGAAISVLNYPTYFTIAKLLNITNNITILNSSKTLTVANQTEVPILHYVTLNTIIDDNSRQFNIPFAVADKKNNLGTHFSKNIIIKSTYKTLQYNLNTTQKSFQIPQNSHHSYQKIIHLSRTFTELILKRKFV